MSSLLDDQCRKRHHRCSPPGFDMEVFLKIILGSRKCGVQAAVGWPLRLLICYHPRLARIEAAG